MLAASAALKAGRRNRLQVDHRIRERSAAGARTPRRPASPATIVTAAAASRPSSADALQPVDHGQHRHQRERRARQVEPAGIRGRGTRAGAAARATSSSTITGSAGRNTEPHQKYSSSRPPTSGPTAAPAEKLAIQTPIASVRCARVLEHVADQRERGGRQRGAGDAEQRARRDQHLGARREAASSGGQRRRRQRRSAAGGACRSGRPACPS